MTLLHIMGQETKVSCWSMPPELLGCPWWACSKRCFFCFLWVVQKCEQNMNMKRMVCLCIVIYYIYYNVYLYMVRPLPRTLPFWLLNLAHKWMIGCVIPCSFQNILEYSKVHLVQHELSNDICIANVCIHNVWHCSHKNQIERRLCHAWRFESLTTFVPRSALLFPRFAVRGHAQLFRPSSCAPWKSL